MVKGTSRRVIVVDSPDPKLFEQAIFIVKNEAFTKEGVTSQQVLGKPAASPRATLPARPASRPSGGGFHGGPGLRRGLYYWPQSCWPCFCYRNRDEGRF